MCYRLIIKCNNDKQRQGRQQPGIQDAYERTILALLQENARLGFSEIGRRIHLTSPAVADRVRRLEEAGVIEGFTTRLNLRKLGYSFEAFVNITVDSHAALDA